jgi:alpha-1,6-mannosyltransferase
VGGLSLAVLVGLSLLAQVGPGWLANLTGPAKVETWLSPTTALGRTLGLIGEAAGLADADALLAAVRVAGAVATAGILLWLLVTASRRSPLRGAGLALLAVVALGPVVQPWYLLWPLPLLAASGLRGTELRWTVGLSLGMSAYTVANTAATTSALGALPEGVAALLAGAVVAAMLLVPRSTRQMLFERARPRARLDAAVPSGVSG